MKYLTTLIAAGAVLGTIAFFGYSPFIKVLGSFGSAAGTTFNTAKIAAVTVNLAAPGKNATSTSILNTDAYDRYVSSYKIGCENVGTSNTAYTGAGLAALTINIGTTTTASPATFSSFAAVTGSGVTLATSTTDLLIASSTLQSATSSLAAVWPTNTYMTFSTNATNTAKCTFGVDYFGS